MMMPGMHVRWRISASPMPIFLENNAKRLSKKSHQIRNILCWYLHCGWATLQGESLQKWLNSWWDAHCEILHIYIKLQKSKRVWSRERGMVNWNKKLRPFKKISSSWLFYDIRLRQRPSLCFSTASWSKNSDIWYSLLGNSQAILTFKLFLLLTWQSSFCSEVQ